MAGLHSLTVSIRRWRPLLDLIHPVKASTRGMDAARVRSVLVVLQAHGEDQRHREAREANASTPTLDF